MSRCPLIKMYSMKPTHINMSRLITLYHTVVAAAPVLLSLCHIRKIWQSFVKNKDSCVSPPFGITVPFTSVKIMRAVLHLQISVFGDTCKVPSRKISNINDGCVLALVYSGGGGIRVSECTENKQNNSCVPEYKMNSSVILLYVTNTPVPATIKFSLDIPLKKLSVTVITARFLISSFPVCFHWTVSLHKPCRNLLFN